MGLEIKRIVLLEDMVEKLRWKHNIEESEVIEMLESYPRFSGKRLVFSRRGRLRGIWENKPRPPIERVLCSHQKQESNNRIRERDDRKRGSKICQIKQPFLMPVAIKKLEHTGINMMRLNLA
ncbi:hypothetical protein RZS08_08375, partial [Arthrospira platensis SPKY1]|nr:hypothetical protein [Arthrospira platensis SPKY1]